MIHYLISIAYPDIETNTKSITTNTQYTLKCNNMERSNLKGHS